jgi:hypothetical protein
MVLDNDSDSECQNKEFVVQLSESVAWALETEREIERKVSNVLAFM